MMNPITRAYLVMIRDGINQMIGLDSDTLGTNEYQLKLTHKQTKKGKISADVDVFDTHAVSQIKPFNVSGAMVPFEIIKATPMPGWDAVFEAFDAQKNLMCPECGHNLESMDDHGHWCSWCKMGFTLKDGAWVVLDEAEGGFSRPTIT